MSNVGREGRSYESIGEDDLKRLLSIANGDLAEFFEKYPNWARLYANRVLCVALCQGAALHYVTGETGINDFDVYTFFKSNPKKAWYAKAIRHHDFGNPKFGQSADHPGFTGRRVACLTRAIRVLRSEDAETALKRYLQEGKTDSARFLAEKAIVLLEPDLGKIVYQGHHDQIRPAGA